MQHRAQPNVREKVQKARGTYANSHSACGFMYVSGVYGKRSAARRDQYEPSFATGGKRVEQKLTVREL